VQPVDELDRLLERTVDGTHELGGIDTDHRQNVRDARNGGFADADPRDVRRFDERDFDAGSRIVAQRSLEIGSRYPAGRAAADDQNPSAPARDQKFIDMPTKKRRPSGS
jgi:hypothetical protein